MEIANANALISAIVMNESEDLSVYVRYLHDLHDLLESLGRPLSEVKKASNLLNSLNTKYFAMLIAFMSTVRTQLSVLGGYGVCKIRARCEPTRICG